MYKMAIALRPQICDVTSPYPPPEQNRSWIRHWLRASSVQLQDRSDRTVLKGPYARTMGVHCKIGLVLKLLKIYR